MEILKGIGVSPGVAISTAVVLDAEDLVIPNRRIDPDAVDVELTRLNRAIDSAVNDLGKLRDATTEQAGKEIGAIFDFHIGLLRDKALVNQIINDIKVSHFT